MNRFCIALLLSLLPLAVNAQEEKQEDQQDTANQEARDAGKIQARAPEKNGSEDADDYQASEEISEDLSVSYPVDI